MSTEHLVSHLKDKIGSLESQVAGLQAGDPIYIGDYLLARLEQLSVTKMFGVPGDFNLGFLDLVEENKSIDWVGNCNELNAAYAADGYARVKSKSIGVVVTTFGVGELSAINGIAGAFSEFVPVLHIVGVPSTTQLKTKPMLHHTLGDGRFEAYEKAASQFTIKQAHILSVETAAAEIDRALEACANYARPVYLTLPTDMAYSKIPSGRLRKPLSLGPAENDKEEQDFVLKEIVNLVKQSQGNVVILVDACAARHHVVEETRQLINATGFPVFCAPMGKGSVWEDHETYGGVYIGSLSHEDIKQKVENADLILSIGGLKSDFNTGNFTYSIPTVRTVELHSHHTLVQYAHYPGIGMKRLLPELTARLCALNLPIPKAIPHSIPSIPDEPSPTITHEWLWPRIGKFLHPRDVIIAETGTSSFGALDVPLPHDALFLTQILWGSIGWTVGSTLGAAFSARDLNLGRTILFIGDGSLQLTVQEISTMIRHGLSPILFVLNNSGYTIERYIHGKQRKYNDIANWKWTELLSVFQGNSRPVGKSYTVRTKEELSGLLDEETFARASEIQLVEIIMDKFDAPPALCRQTELSKKTNSYGPAQ